MTEQGQAASAQLTVVTAPAVEFTFRKDSARQGAAYVESWESIVVLMKVRLDTQHWTRARPVGRIGATFDFDKAAPLGSKPKFKGYGWYVHGTDKYGVPSRRGDDPKIATLDAAKADCELYLNRHLLYPVYPP